MIGVKKRKMSASTFLICCANQLTGFYTRATLALDGLMKQIIDANLDLFEVTPWLWVTSNDFL